MRNTPPADLIALMNQKVQENVDGIAACQTTIVNLTNQIQLFSDQITNLNNEIDGINDQITQLNLEIGQIDEIIAYIPDGL